MSVNRCYRFGIQLVLIGVMIVLGAARQAMADFIRRGPFELSFQRQ